MSSGLSALWTEIDDISSYGPIFGAAESELFSGPSE
jgi:hypothetical protein